MLHHKFIFLVIYTGVISTFNTLVYGLCYKSLANRNYESKFNFSLTYHDNRNKKGDHIKSSVIYFIIKFIQNLVKTIIENILSNVKYLKISSFTSSRINKNVFEREN